MSSRSRGRSASLFKWIKSGIDATLTGTPPTSQASDRSKWLVSILRIICRSRATSGNRNGPCALQRDDAHDRGRGLRALLQECVETGRETGSSLERHYPSPAIIRDLVVVGEMIAFHLEPPRQEESPDGGNRVAAPSASANHRGGGIEHCLNVSAISEFRVCDRIGFQPNGLADAVAPMAAMMMMMGMKIAARIDHPAIPSSPRWIPGLIRRFVGVLKSGRVEFGVRNRRLPEEMDMSPELIAILAVGVSVIALLSRMSIRLTAVEKETARLSGLLEGLGLAGRIPPTHSSGET